VFTVYAARRTRCRALDNRLERAYDHGSVRREVWSVATAMRPAIRLPSSFAHASPARAILGIEHPLVRLLEREDVARRDLLAVAALLPGIAAVAVVSLGAALLLLAAVAATSLALGCVLGALRARRRELVLKLILEGHERLPVAAVAAERRRLADPAYRGMLARTLERIRVAARDQPAWLRSSTVTYDAGTILVAEPHIRRVETLLRSERVGARGVALTLRLLVDGGSPLHACDERRLSEELARIALLIQSE
jgi:hypothetical protein